VLIARALMAKPRLLILDEPCAGLDPVARERFLRWLNALGRSSAIPGLILVTHHVEEIVPAFSHVLMLRDGQVAASGLKRKALTSAKLTVAFGAKVKQGRWELRA
jgi:iron complex transport system ATP-binding protein